VRATGRSKTRGTPPDSALIASVLDAWSTNDRVTTFLIERIPAELWTAEIPGSPRRTIRMIAVHIHNARSRWIRTLGAPHGIAPPPLLDRHRATRAGLVRALGRSGRAMARLLAFGIERGGQIPPTPVYVWRNLPLDVGHVLSYFVAHEGHHRGQIVMVARQLGHRLSRETINGLWQFNRRSIEAKDVRR